ncbi:TlpA family protein disulfide reductase [Micromonospora radicis]|uniref:TlpA family protein disulfide reductase n=1 Tax=Micromonospora radicis TaxID=1894971 RepID=A0A418MPS2_9ACTN|nr:TlpA disulfide reductase family protein [Micromonospora radicis]RIV34497.1 TlpA family protein disulfide reductase [Micromonospora radicis]
MIRRLALLSVPLLLLVSGCTAGTGQPASPSRPEAATGRPSPFADCAALTTAPDGSAAAGPSAGAGGDTLLPELSLTCFTGGAPVALREVRGPAVINVWASWCPPCRKELPAFQRLHQRADGQLRVFGVNAQDSRAAAQAIGEDFGIRFPVLVDQGQAVQRALRRNAIPLTVFLDGDGRIRHVDTSGALDDARLAELVEQHLGIAVPA